MKRCFILFLFPCAFACAQAPVHKVWDKIYGGSQTESVLSIEAAGNHILLFGSSNSNNSFEKTENSKGLQDYWLLKLDTAGHVVWNKTYGGNYEDDAVKAIDGGFGTYLISGTSLSGISGDKTFANHGSSDYWILRVFETTGIVFLNQVFGGNNKDELADVITTSDNGVLLAGTSYSDSSGDKTTSCLGINDFWIVKTDFYLTKQWEKRFGGFGSDVVSKIIQTHDGGFVIAGSSDSNAGGEKSANTKGGFDYWIIKTDSSGNKLWDRSFGGTFDEYAFNIIETPDGNLFVCGISNTFQPSGDKTIANHGALGASDYWLLKLDSAGNKIWDKAIGGNSFEDDFSSIRLMSDGNLLLSGTSYSGIGGNKTESNLGTEQIWMIKIDTTGNIIWDKTVTNPGHNETGLGVVTIDSSIYLTTYQMFTTPGGMQSVPVHATGISDYWLIKFGTDALLQPSVGFASSDSIFCEKQCIDFFDLSNNYPVNWQWFFPGANPDTSTLQNPTGICYNGYGSFDVTLIACNGIGCDTLTINNFITENQNPANSIWQSNDTIYSQPAVSYQWFESTNGLISGATNQYYIIQQPGSYYCLINDSIGCVGVSNIIVVTGLDFVPNANSHYIVQPNPNNGNFELVNQFTSNTKSHLSLFDISGRLLFEKEIADTKNIFDFKLNDGLYFLQLSNAEETFNLKLIVKR